VLVVVLVLVLENPDRFAIRLTEQIRCRTSDSLRSRNHCTEDDDEDDFKFRNLGQIQIGRRRYRKGLNALSRLPRPKRGDC
jgi:hypothetical protein